MCSVVFCMCTYVCCVLFCCVLLCFVMFVLLFCLLCSVLLYFAMCFCCGGFLCWVKFCYCFLWCLILLLCFVMFCCFVLFCFVLLCCIVFYLSCSVAVSLFCCFLSLLLYSFCVCVTSTFFVLQFVTRKAATLSTAFKIDALGVQRTYGLTTCTFVDICHAITNKSCQMNVKDIFTSSIILIDTDCRLLWPNPSPKKEIIFSIPWSGAHYPEPPYVLYPWINPFQ